MWEIDSTEAPGRQGDHQEGTARVRAREDNSWNKNRGVGGGEKWLNSRWILKVKLTGFVEGLDKQERETSG